MLNDYKVIAQLQISIAHLTLHLRIPPVSIPVTIYCH